MSPGTSRVSLKSSTCARKRFSHWRRARIGKILTASRASMPWRRQCSRICSSTTGSRPVFFTPSKGRADTNLILSHYTIFKRIEIGLGRVFRRQEDPKIDVVAQLCRTAVGSGFMNQLRREEQRISHLHVNRMPNVGMRRGFRQAMGPRSVRSMVHSAIQMAAIVQDEPANLIVNVGEGHPNSDEIAEMSVVGEVLMGWQDAARSIGRFKAQHGRVMHIVFGGAEKAS